VSQYYKLRGTYVWNAGMSSSRQFRRYLTAFEAELAAPSGVGPMEPDDVSEIDPEVFGAFVAALLHWYRSHICSSDTELLSSGFVTMVLALAERAGIPVDWPVEEQLWPREQLAALRERVHMIARRMAS
jgi:hypothetical protein